MHPSQSVMTLAIDIDIFEKLPPKRSLQKDDRNNGVNDDHRVNRRAQTESHTSSPSIRVSFGSIFRFFAAHFSSLLDSMKTASNMVSRVSKTRRLKDLATPAFVINRHTFERNCQSMLEMATERNLSLRPHVKTHKTVQGAVIQATGSLDIQQMDSLVTGFVASTLPEVQLLVETSPQYGGAFHDVLYGVPISESKLEALHALRRKMPASGKIHIMIDHPTQVKFVEDYVNSHDSGPFSVFLKLDTGYHRAGITCDERGVELALQILRSPAVELKGVYSHCGHSYDENELAKQLEIANGDMERVQLFLELLKGRLESTQEETDTLVSSLIVSIGSTPSARHHYNTLDLPNKVEIHPGNYTFFDRQQLWIRACTEADLAGRVMSRVIGHYEDRNTMMLDAGATALTKDATPQGDVCAIGGHPELECYKMSQEVILVKPRDASTILDFDEFPLGTIVNLLPNHSCLAAACFERYYVIDDPSCSFSPQQEIVDEWIPAKYFDIR